MAILLSVVFGLLVSRIHVAGLTLCDTDGTLEVVESTASNVFICTGAVTTHTIFWIHQRSNGNVDLATCGQLPASCNNPYKPQFKASRPADDRSTLTVNGSTTSYLQYIQGQTIGCKTSTVKGSPGSSQQTQCTVDIVAVPSVTCDAHYNTGTSSPWTVTGNCSVSGAYSYLNRYTCNLIQTSPTTKSLGSGSLTVTSTSGGGKYKTGYCQVTVPYPDVTGNYSYKMAVTPGRQEVNASFGDRKSFEIKRPSTPPSHNCPQYVGESQGTSCTCTATDLGQPAGVVRWTSSMTNQLSLSNVNKNDNGATYTCQVIWSGQRTQSVTYTLQVAYGPSSVSITHPPFPYDTNGQQQLTLTCSASDVIPAPTFTWGKGSANNVVGQGRTYMFRPQPPGDDNSVFVCRAVNSITGTSRQETTTLTLNYPPTQNPVITITSTPSNSGGHLYQGDRVTLTCAVTGGKPFSATTVTFTCPGKQDSPDIVGTSGVTSTVTFDNLTAADHDKVCTCTTRWKNTNWYNKNKTVKLFVNYPPSISSFEVNFSPASPLTVNAGDVLNLSCRAVGRPPPETKLNHPSKTLIARTPQGSPSVADTPSVVSGKLTARCRDTGIYTCTADNTVGSAQQQTFSIFVRCKPEARNDADHGSIPPVNYRIEAVQLNFSVTAYPVPELKRVKFFKQKPDDTAVGQAAEEGTVAVKCFPDSNVSADVTCQVTVDNIKPSYAGFYHTFVGNDFGDLRLEFEVTVNATYIEPEPPGFSVVAVVGVIVAVLVVSAIIVVVVIRRRRSKAYLASVLTATSIEPDPDPEPGFPVGAVIGAIVAVLVVSAIIVAVVLVIRRRRERKDNPAPQFNDHRSPGDAGVYELQDTGEPSSARQQQIHQPPQFNEQRSQRDAGVYELTDTGEPNALNVTDPYTTPSDYDSLQTSDMGLRSVYTSLSSPGYNAGAAGDTGPSYVNNSEAGPVYVNKNNSKTEPVYVNKDNSKTEPVYVNKDNSKTGPVYVNKDNSKTGPVYVNKDNSKTGPVYVNKAPQRNQPSTSQASSSPYEDVGVPNANPVIKPKPKPKPKPQQGASAAQVATTSDVHVTVNTRNVPQSVPQDSSPVSAADNKKKEGSVELPTATPGAMKENPKVGKKRALNEAKQKGTERNQTTEAPQRNQPNTSQASSSPYEDVDGPKTKPVIKPKPKPKPQREASAAQVATTGDAVATSHKPEPEPEGSRTVDPDGLVYMAVASTEEQLKKAKDPPPVREKTAYAGLEFSQM